MSIHKCMISHVHMFDILIVVVHYILAPNIDYWNGCETNTVRHVDYTKYLIFNSQCRLSSDCSGWFSVRQKNILFATSHSWLNTREKAECSCLFIAISAAKGECWIHFFKIKGWKPLQWLNLEPAHSHVLFQNQPKTSLCTILGNSTFYYSKTLHSSTMSLQHLILDDELH